MGLRNVIENSLRASESPALVEMRKEQVRLLQPPAKRLAVQAIDGFVFAATSPRRVIADRSAAAAGLQFVWGGVEADVYRRGDSVIKYVRESVRLSDLGRRELVKTKQDNFASLQSDLGAFVMDQEILMAPHLFKPGYDVVQTEQPFVDFTPIMARSTTTGNLELLPGVTVPRDELSDFLDGAWALFAREYMLPDLAGADNLVMDQEGHLKLIDTQPIGTSAISTQVRIIETMHAMRAELQKTAA